ncbi:MAG: OmpA family protein [Verrucomicrobia bacterium]|nr:OmpA family protein [Verrucomicrobiota bacterium]
MSLFHAMAQRIGKCTNYSGCKLAYRNEKITVVTKDFRCPECGSPLEPIGPRKSSSATLFILLGVLLVLLLAIGAVIWTLMTPPNKVVVVVSPTPIATPLPTPTPTPIPTPTVQPTPTIPPTPAPTPTVLPAATPEPTAGAINLDIELPEIAEVKRAVLKRIDAMPNVSEQSKQRLYESVDRAHGMGRLFTVPFDTSNTRITSPDIAMMKTQLERPQIKKLLDDPTLVLVVLGYADIQGDDQRNLQISTARAQSVSDALRTQCGVLNVIHPVPMGGTNLLDPKELAKNRIVEVWAVLP